MKHSQYAVKVGKLVVETRMIFRQACFFSRRNSSNLESLHHGPGVAMNLRLISSFGRVFFLQAKPMLEMGPALPKGMVEVAQEILKTSKSLQVGNLDRLVWGFCRLVV